MRLKVWRERAVYAAMSVFVVWHSLEIFVAPAPDDGEAAQALRSLFHPYLTLLALDNPWDFFAPNINTGHRLRYIVEAADGTSHAFVPLDELNWYFPYFMWMGQWQDAIVDAPEIYADAAAALFCQEHASMQPVAVTIAQVEQNEFGPEDYLGGKHPFDPDFVTETTLTRVLCPAQ
jgi:hypothetical protein